MGLKSKEPESGAPAPQNGKGPRTDVHPSAGNPAPGETRGPRINPDVEKRLNPYIDANKDVYDRYLALARENPERAARSMMLKDLDYLEREATLNKKQIAGAKEWLERQPADVKEFVGNQLEGTTHAAQKDMRLLQLVLNRMRFENSRALAATPTAPAPKTGAGMKVA
jgi:hypothetical protein